jgi:hypothetical protein
MHRIQRIFRRVGWSQLCSQSYIASLGHGGGKPLIGLLGTDVGTWKIGLRKKHVEHYGTGPPFSEILNKRAVKFAGPGPPHLHTAAGERDARVIDCRQHDGRIDGRWLTRILKTNVKSGLLQ